MPILRAGKTIATYKRERVHVPEFGEAENPETGEMEAYYVFARQLTIGERRQVAERAVWVNRQTGLIRYNYPQVCWLAAVDGDEGDTMKGTRVFPSAEFLEGLPPEYEEAIERVARKVLLLSDLIREGPSPNGSEPDAELENNVAAADSQDPIVEAKND